MGLLSSDGVLEDGLQDMVMRAELNLLQGGRYYLVGYRAPLNSRILVIAWIPST